METMIKRNFIKYFEIKEIDFRLVENERYNYFITTDKFARKSTLMKYLMIATHFNDH